MWLCRRFAPPSAEKKTKKKPHKNKNPSVAAGLQRIICGAKRLAWPVLLDARLLSGQKFLLSLHPPANSEGLPSSFAASSLTRSPVSLRAIRRASTAHPQRHSPPLPNHHHHPSRPPPRLCAGTVIKTSFPLLQQGKTFKIQTAAALSVYVWY